MVNQESLYKKVTVFKHEKETFQFVLIVLKCFTSLQAAQRPFYWLLCLSPLNESDLWECFPPGTGKWYLSAVSSTDPSKYP